MANELQGKEIAFVITPEGAEQVDLVKELYEFVKDAGGSSELLMTDTLEERVFDDLCEIVIEAKIRRPYRVSEVNASDYHGLLVPGVANSDPSQMDQDVASFGMAFVNWGGILMKIRRP